MIAKDSSKGTLCVLCARQAQEGTDPPLCPEHASRALRKQADDYQPATLAELSYTGHGHDK